ncbi:MAG TPA: hypothetical protein VGR87_11250 [Candidatus Limnocylindria bacterium]|jgi:hypothetical protein|nr:hypothetical protein [Candidatus Limnocylindria bacterium]
MAIAEKKDLYTFPGAPDAVAPEWPGTPIGAKNTITRTKGRTLAHDKTVDAKPGLFRRLLANAFEHIATAKEPTYSHDVVIHGLRVRAITNSEHLIGYWKDNWYGVDEWERITGKKPAETPHVLVVALGRVSTESEAAYYSRQNDTVIFFNTSYYGQLKSWVLGAVGRKLAVEFGIHSIHGAVVTKDGKGILYIAPTGTGKSTSTYGVMEFPNTRFHSDDWVYVRYAYRTKDDKTVSPARILSGGEEVARGYQTYRWLEEHRGSDATVIGRGLDDREITASAPELDIDHPEAYAYTSEKVFYLRSNLVENFPQAAFDMVRSRLENAPDVTPDFLAENKATIDAVAAKLRGTGKPPFDRMSDDEVRQTIGRFFAFDNTRAMLDITTVFPKERVFTNPMEPARIHAVMLIKRNFDEDVVIERLTLEKFMARLLVGLTPAGTKEIVYNSYRAVDDKSERAWIDTIEAKGVDRMWGEYQKAKDKPETLVEEMEMFRMLFKSAAAYDLNTVLQKDKAIGSKMEAVHSTMRIIVKALENAKESFRYTISDYRKLIE